MKRLHDFLKNTAHLPDADVEAIMKRETLTVESGVQLFAPGDRCSGLPLLLSGSIQVWLTHHSGREFLWYELLPGNLCLASTGAILSDSLHRAYAKTKSPTEMVVIPTGTVDEMLATSTEFRAYVLQGYVSRWHSALESIYEVVFLTVDQRLAVELLTAETSLRITHQELADRLGTAREVVTRTLSRFQEAGAIHLERGQITVIRRGWLQRIVNPFSESQ